MKIYYRFFFVLFITFFLGTSIAQVPDGINVIKSSRGYQIDFTLQPYQMFPGFGEGEEFINLSVSGYGITPEEGLPALPLISFNLFIGDNEESPQFEINSLSQTAQTLDKKIFPKQKPWEKNNPLDEREFFINRDYYNSDGESLPFVKISDPFIIGGVKGVMVTIYPFSYNPKQNKLSVIESGSFEIILSQTDQTSTIKSDAYNNFLQKLFVNYNPVQSLSSMRYLIITAPAFETGMASYVTHKQSAGFTVDFFNTNITGTTTTAIKTFIQNRYNDPNTKPEFVLLVGDVQHIPSWIGSGAGNPNTDLNYVQLEGSDYFADAFIGRFSVTTAAELQNVINKSVYMENYIATLAKKNIWMASTDNYQISEGTHNYCIDTHFQPAGYINLKLYTVTYGATTAQLIAALNDNQRFAVYSGHGSETSWADGPPLNQSQVRSLTNTTMYPFVFSFACITGSYHISECFGETWIRDDNAASTFYGSSVNSYWDEDDILERKLFDAMFYDDLTRITPMMDQAKIYLANYYGGVTSTVLRYMEMYNLMGDPSMPVVRQIPPDTTPPDPITNLSVGDITSNSISLNWTAPYDSTFGGVVAYDIRYSTSPITNDNEFNNAPQRMLTGVSDSAGTPRSFTVDELDFNTPYYFAVKAMDMWSNKSPMSNLPTGTTWFAPLCNVTPDSMYCLVLPDSSTTETLTIINTSTQNSTLDYSIILTNNTFPGDVFVSIKGNNEAFENIPEGKKEMPNDFMGYSFKGSGGPDLFGYRWKDSNEPDGPEYIWTDIRTNPGAVQVTSWSGTLDDGYTQAIAIGFDFDFYGNTYANFYLSTNGFLSFSSLSSAYYSNYGIPDSDLPNNLIAPIWDDLDGRNQGTVHYLRESGKLTIQYTDWQHYPTTGSYTFQIVLKSNNRIYFYFNNLVGTLNSATVGIENQSGTDGLQVAYNAAYLENQLAVMLAADPEWLSLNNYSGTIYNGNSVDIELLMNTDGLELGDYSMDVEITTNDPANPLIVVPIHMTVTNVIPVELVSFNAEMIDGNVNLNWITATETNNQGFEIQKREVKNNVNGEWQVSGFVNGVGTSTEQNQYSFVDKNSKPGNFSYRLKQIDFDGTYSFSNEIEIDVIGPKDYALYQNYPNPFNPSTTIKIAIPVKTDVTLSVYNLLGEKVAEILKGEMEAGYYEMNFNAAGLSSGIYFYRIESDKLNAIKKMILLK